MSTITVPALDRNKRDDFIGPFAADLGIAVQAGMVVIGEKLGLYKALAERPLTTAHSPSRENSLPRGLRGTATIGRAKGEQGKQRSFVFLFRFLSLLGLMATNMLFAAPP